MRARDGAGDVIVWDWGRSEPGPSVEDAEASFHADEPQFRLEGEKLHGAFVLVRTGGPPAPPRAVARQAQWVRPDLVIRAEFAGWTGDGMVRQAAFKGYDLGKDPVAVMRERPRR